MSEDVLVRSGKAEFWVRVDDASGPSPIGSDDVLSLESVRKAVEEVDSQLSAAWDWVEPSESVVELGLTLTAKSGKLTLTVDDEGSFKTTLRWSGSGPASRNIGMDNGTESQELHRYDVRVDSDDRHPQGTGFVVAPGWVLPCAHMMKAATRPARRTAVDVMTMTRDKRDALDGWASPISALLTGGRGVPDDLAEPRQRSVGPIKPAVLRDRASWHRGLFVDCSDDTLERPKPFVVSGRPAAVIFLRTSTPRQATIHAAVHVVWNTPSLPLGSDGFLLKFARSRPGGGNYGRLPPDRKLSPRMVSGGYPRDTDTFTKGKQLI